MRSFAIPVLVTVFMLSMAPGALAQRPEPAHFEILVGGSPFGCGNITECGFGGILDGGATGWLTEHIGVSARARSAFLMGGGPHWAEVLVRTRWVAGNDREVDIGFGRGFFYEIEPSWKGEVMVGFRPYDRVGFKVGGEYGRYSGDSTILVSFLVVVRPGRQ